MVTPVNDVATPHGSPTYIDNSVTESVATPLEKTPFKPGRQRLQNQPRANQLVLKLNLSTILKFMQLPLQLLPVAPRHMQMVPQLNL